MLGQRNEAVVHHSGDPVLVMRARETQRLNCNLTVRARVGRGGNGYERCRGYSFHPTTQATAMFSGRENVLYRDE